MTTTTRSEHHADSDKSKVRQAKQRIAWILRRRDNREWAISSKGLADAVGLKATTVRDIIKEIRTEYNVPVIACSDGYYTISDTVELEREIERIQAEINTRKETKTELVQAFNARRYDDEQ